MRLLTPIFSFLLLLASADQAFAAAPSNTALRVMTFNVRYSEAHHDGVNAWEHRRDLAAATIEQQHPDIVGTQELLMPQATYLADKLKSSGYVWFGRGRNGNETDKDDNEHMGVFYNTKRLKLLKQDDFWYSDTPDVPGSMSFGQPLPRMVTWAQFQDLTNGKRFYYFNTHMPYQDNAEAIRQRCAQQLLQRIQALDTDHEPVIVTGDFNSAPSAGTHALLSQSLQDARQSAAQKLGPDRTFHNFTGKPTTQLDWILFRGLNANRVETLTHHDGNVYPSDHFPVVADLLW